MQRETAAGIKRARSEPPPKHGEQSPGLAVFAGLPANSRRQDIVTFLKDELLKAGLNHYPDPFAPN
eukprot:7405027-Prorocentrum_lima.AAC.1